METEGHARQGQGRFPRTRRLANQCAQKGNLTGSGPVRKHLDACPARRRNLCVESGSGAVSEQGEAARGCEGKGRGGALRAGSIECRHHSSVQPDILRRSPRSTALAVALRVMLGRETPRNLHCPLRSRLSTYVHSTDVCPSTHRDIHSAEVASLPRPPAKEGDQLGHDASRATPSVALTRARIELPERFIMEGRMVAGWNGGAGGKNGKDAIWGLGRLVGGLFSLAAGFWGCPRLVLARACQIHGCRGGVWPKGEMAPTKQNGQNGSQGPVGRAPPSAP